MSHYATPVIVINLGCEMLFVIEQRLKAQHIERDKADRVLTDITTVLLHPRLLDELFTPQPVATHVVIKQLLQDISSTSIMKLDDYSMTKLWDLMTMLIKWQISLATTQTIFDITRRHLKSVAAVMPSYFPKIIIEQAMKRFYALSQRFSDVDYDCLRSTMILWFSEYHTKISVLLRLGLQRKDGTFNMPATINPNILNNLGENIYKYNSKKSATEEYETKCSDTHEISCLLSAIETKSNEHQIIEIQLPIELNNQESTKRTLNLTKNTHFEKIKPSIKSPNYNLVADLTFHAEVTKPPREDLLDLLNKDDA